jgi:hypothetical protein
MLRTIRQSTARDGEFDADVYGRASMIDRSRRSITPTRSFQDVIALGNFVAPG